MHRFTVILSEYSVDVQEIPEGIISLNVKANDAEHALSQVTAWVGEVSDLALVRHTCDSMCEFRTNVGRY